jgi:hypothetical protein
MNPPSSSKTEMLLNKFFLTLARVTAKIQGSEKDLVVAAKYGFATLDKTTGEVSYILKVEKEDDGKAERYIFTRFITIVMAKAEVFG